MAKNAGNDKRFRGQGLPSGSKTFRGADRMMQFNETHALSPEMALEAQVRGEFQKAEIRRSHNPKKTTQRPSKNRSFMLDEYPSTIRTQTQEELMYDGEAMGSVCTVENNSHNFDFATYPVLLKTIYETLCVSDTRLRRTLPYCAFLHHYTVILNATIIQRSKDQNQDNRFQGESDPFEVIDAPNLVIPAPIQDYLDGFGIAEMQDGTRVHANLPGAAIPQHVIGEPNLPSGSFGPITAENHNAYECYISPWITRSLIERTIVANGNQNFGPWNPFPAAAHPVGAVPTPNLLGYTLPARLEHDGIAFLTGLHFANEDTMAGRLAYSQELSARVNSQMTRYVKEFDVRIGISFAPPPNPSAFVVTRQEDRCAHTDSIADHHGKLIGPEKFGTTAANHASFFSFKRYRSVLSRGPSMVVGHLAPQGWNETANENLRMAGVFGPNFGVDYPFLRENRFQEGVLSGTRSDSIRAWLQRHFVKTKM